MLACKWCLGADRDRGHSKECKEHNKFSKTIGYFTRHHAADLPQYLRSIAHGIAEDLAQQQIMQVVKKPWQKDRSSFSELIKRLSRRHCRPSTSRTWPKQKEGPSKNFKKTGMPQQVCPSQGAIVAQNKHWALQPAENKYLEGPVRSQGPDLAGYILHVNVEFPQRYAPVEFRRQLV